MCRCKSALSTAVKVLLFLVMPRVTALADWGFSWGGGGVLPTKTLVHDSRCYKRGFLPPTNKGGVLQMQTQVHDSRFSKRLFSCPIAKGESYSPKLQCMTKDFCKQLNSFTLESGESYPLKLKCMTPDVATTFLLPIRHGGVLPTQSQVHDSRCCKRHFSYPLKGGESYPPKLKSMTPGVASDYSAAH